MRVVLPLTAVLIYLHLFFKFPVSLINIVLSACIVSVGMIFKMKWLDQNKIEKKYSRIALGMDVLVIGIALFSEFRQVAFMKSIGLMAMPQVIEILLMAICEKNISILSMSKLVITQIAFTLLCCHLFRESSFVFVDVPVGLLFIAELLSPPIITRAGPS